MYIFNAILRLEYWPKSLKTAQIIMIPKTWEKSNRRFILTTIHHITKNLKLLERLILRKLNKT
jgi:hypothetical protein